MTVSGAVSGFSPKVLNALRETEFPWTGGVTYVNNASIGPLPDRTRRLLDGFNARRAAPHTLLDEDNVLGLPAARRTVARLIGADAAEIALATNTTYGLNVAAGALPLRAGDTVLLSDREFPANVYPWQRLRRRGVNVETVPTTPEGWPDEARLLERLRDPWVRVLAVSLVQFSNGYRVDLGALSAACRESDTYLVVDAIQGLGHVPFDVRATPVDLLACGGQKWLLGPWGSGFVYARRDLIPTLEPATVGWMAFEGTDDFTRLTDYKDALHGDARRLEMATVPYQDLRGLTTSIELLLELGVPAIAQHTRALRAPLLDAAERGVLRIVSPADPAHSCSIVCITVDDVPATFERLKTAGVVCAQREGAIRLSPHCYNTVDEMAKVVDVLSAE